MGQHSIYVWIGFNVFVLAMLALDLGVFHKKSHRVGFREAMIWTAVWITLALSFNLLIYLREGSEPALAFLTGYVIEKSLSVDNIFVILMIFTYFRVPAEYQHKVLFWGILGALFMRGVFIIAGVTLIQKYHWVVFVFGGFLILSGLKMAMPKEEEVSLDKNFVLRLTKKIIPTTSEYEGAHFFVRKNGKRMATPLLAALVMVEFTDLIFAVDSIPAILAITPDAFLVYTSNVFAILGLRSLYFAVSGLMDIFHFLQYGLAAILTFVGVKMLLTDVYPIPTGIALAVIVGILLTSIVASKIWPAHAAQPK
ncbi:MAG: TerC family protein [Bdellovibrionota bacterium]